jgi:hypothetical protein
VALVVFTNWLAKVSEVGERAAIALTPVPDSEAVCGLPFSASSLIVSVPVRVPVVVGVKETLTVQVPPAATTPQLLVCEKSPEIEILETLRGAVPLLVTVMACGTLVVFMFWPPKVSDDGDSAAIEAMPVPASATAGAAPGLLLFKVSVPLRLPVAVGLNVMLT